MKRIIGGLVIIIVLLFSYYYQTPILSTNEATIKAVEILQDPPKEWRLPCGVKGHPSRKYPSSANTTSRVLESISK